MLWNVTPYKYNPSLVFDPFISYKKITFRNGSFPEEFTHK